LFSASLSAATNSIFPTPREFTASAAAFPLDQRAVIAVPANPSEQDLFLAQSLQNELSDWYGQHLKIARLDHLDGLQPAILMGSTANPLVAQYCAEHACKVDPRSPGPEGYLLRTSASLALVAGSDDRGAR